MIPPLLSCNSRVGSVSVSVSGSDGPIARIIELVRFRPENDHTPDS
jgi:hypothetical protein